MNVSKHGMKQLSRSMTKHTKWLVRSLIRAFAVGSMDLSFFMRTAKTLIRLGGCPGWSESSLGAQIILLVLSSCGWTDSARVWITAMDCRQSGKHSYILSLFKTSTKDRPFHICLWQKYRRNKTMQVWSQKALQLVCKNQILDIYLIILRRIWFSH